MSESTELTEYQPSTITLVLSEPKSVRARRMIEEVEAALRTNVPAQVSSMYPEYQKEFPKIFEMLLSRSYPKEILEMMLKQLEKIEDGRSNTHNASIAVGTVLVDRFVKPQLGLR
jgi:hypothetical protein